MSSSMASSSSTALSRLEKLLFSPKGSYEVTKVSDIPTWKETQSILARLQGREGVGVPTGTVPCEPETRTKKNQKTDSRTAVLANTFSLVWDDLTTLRVDCIVNAANRSFTCGGGINGSIHRKAGPDAMKQACQQAVKATTSMQMKRSQTAIDKSSKDDSNDTLDLDPLIGDCIATPGFGLPCQYVIHTVSPSLLSQDLLSQCYKHALDMALDVLKASSIAFCNLGCGSHFIPVDQAAEVALEACMEWAKRRLVPPPSQQPSSALQETHPTVPFRIIFCCYEESDLIVYRDKMLAKLPVSA
ncbi:Macro domain-containing protein [Seminavis robusta]|uniref:Macro domain-containing protein n=1 Tax=Seminavis robusta TaxID=568900 RepID=A0A9N8DCG8_9STRA|nr:Macro domain-containing protein [Seminavis robusta]|eukprot:Sro33_g021720.1 Macro domain-containing protein (301) ;mRNA; f:150255-151157